MRLLGKYLWIVLLVPVSFFLFRSFGSAFASGVDVPPPAVNESLAPKGPLQTAVFAGGCFWGVQGVFQHVKGVSQALSGYSGGDQNTAQYETVSTGKTGHAESVEITYDPSAITYGELLQIYFSVVADPTELNYQGPDHGTQYRSAIFYQTPEQENIAENYVAQLGKAHVFPGPIVTSMEPFKAFYPAETYHQDFLSQNPDYPYIAINDMPKVDNLKKMFPALYRDKPVLVTAHN